MNGIDFENKKILILGLGREGMESLRFFLAKYPQNEIGAADKSEVGQLNPELKKIFEQNHQVKLCLGQNYLSCLNDYDVIVKSPGVPIHISEIEKAYQEQKIISQTEIFFNYCPGIIIGVTGTKGKSTVSSIIYEIIKRSGKKTFLAGNIGTPMLQFLDGADKETIFICELSAHQLYNMGKSPHVAVLLNIYPEHLDYYKDYSEYIRAKANIAIHQSKEDYFVYNSANNEARQIAQESAANKIAFNECKWNFSKKVNLIGDFNLENAKVGVIVGRLLKISDEDIDSAIAEFRPLGNRLEFVGNFNGIDFYNDSLSTIQESAIAAIDALGDRAQTLIAGGFDRGQPFGKLADKILASKIKTLILFPETGKRIWESVEAAADRQKKCLARISPFFVSKMNVAVDLALEKTQKGRICLLSAASASFGNFRDYAHRGECFKNCLMAQSNIKKGGHD